METQEILAGLAHWKNRFGPGQPERIAELLDAAADGNFTSAKDLIQLHELVLFVRAYPPDATALAKSENLLAGFSARVHAIERAGADLYDFEESDAAGIAGSGLTAVFSYEAARSLSQRHGSAIRIDWDRHDGGGNLIHLLPLLTPMLDDDALVEAEVPWREWLENAAGGAHRALPWLLERLEQYEPDRRVRADRYQSLGLPLRWEFGDGPAARTHIRLPGGGTFFHDAPLIRRNEIRLDTLPYLEPLPRRALTAAEGAEVIDLARDTSASRFRELHGFNYGDAATVREFDAGRGVRLFLWELEPAHRLPLRAYHAATMWKNGIPIGYFESLTLFDRVEAAINVYYTFREGESAWLYRQMLKMLHQEFAFRTISVDPYQIGHKNPEAIDSGAFWFYRKLGFRSTGVAAQRITAREERRMTAQQGYRSPAAVLKKLAEDPMVLELPGSTPGEWDGFSTRRAGMALARGRISSGPAIADHWRPLVEMAAADPGWTAADRAGLDAIIEAKAHLSETEYLARMRDHSQLRALFLRLGRP